MFEGIEILLGGAEPHFGDLDADGDPDLAVACSFRSVVQYSERTLGGPTELQWADMGFVAGVQLGSGGHPAIALGDIDGDADLDLLVAYYLGENFLYLNETVSSVEPVTWGRIKSMFR